MQVRLRSEEDVRQGRTTAELEEAVSQQTLDEIDRGKKPCPPGDRAWFEGCLGTDKVQSCLAAIQKAEIMKALSDSKLIDKVTISRFARVSFAFSCNHAFNLPWIWIITCNPNCNRD